MNFTASVRKEILEQVRTNRLLILGAVLLAFGLMSPLLAKYMPELFQLIPGGEAFSGMIPTPTIADAVGQYVKNVNQFGVLLALLLTMGMVALEKERGTAAMMLVKPVSRPGFILSKFIAISLAFLAGLILAGAGSYYYTAILFQAPNFAAWMGLTLLIWVELEVYVALTLLFSTLFRSQAAAAGMGFAVIIVFSIFGAIPGLAKYLPAQLLQWGAGLVLGQAETALAALFVSLGLVVGSLLIAWIAFERQEI